MLLDSSDYIQIIDWRKDKGMKEKNKSFLDVPALKVNSYWNCLCGNGMNDDINYYLLFYFRSCGLI